MIELAGRRDGRLVLVTILRCGGTLALLPAPPGFAADEVMDGLEVAPDWDVEVSGRRGIITGAPLIEADLETVEVAALVLDEATGPLNEVGGGALMTLGRRLTVGTIPERLGLLTGRTLGTAAFVTSDGRL